MPPSFWQPFYCNGSGSAILPGDRHFKCQACGELYLEPFRFEDQPICRHCAPPGIETPAAEATAVAPSSPPLVDIPSDGDQGDYYHGRLKKLGVAESDWIKIPAGEFMMGSPSTETDRFSNERQHRVSVDSFYILRTPVTFAMYDLYRDELKLQRPADEGWGRDSRPAINVSYWDTLDYCIWLQKKSGWNIRLPTEAEWEYACRAGTTTPFSTGEQITTDQANFDGGFSYDGSPKGIKRGQTTPADQFAPNPWGLYDMHGNVWEWCASIYDESYSGREKEDACYQRDNLSERVVRGGSWYNVPGGLRSASRNKMAPQRHYLRIGFRIVREAE